MFETCVALGSLAQPRSCAQELKVGLIILRISVSVTTAYAKRTGATARMERRRREPARAISPDSRVAAPVRAQTLIWELKLVESAALDS